MSKKSYSNAVDQMARSLIKAGHTSYTGGSGSKKDFFGGAPSVGSLDFSFKKKQYANPLDLIKLGDNTFTPTAVGVDEKTGEKKYNNGKKFSELDYETQMRLVRSEQADAEAGALGKPREKKTSLFHKIIDNISRPLYGVAQGAKEGFEKVADPDNKSNDLLDAVTGFGSGFSKGVTLKKKATFSDVIQRVADAKHAADEGRSIKDTREGEGKVNKFIKYGGGLTADIFLDPTTYLGAGFIAKAPRVKRTIKALNESGAVAADLAKTGQKIDLGEKVANVGKLSQRQQNKLTSEGKIQYDIARAAQTKKGAILPGMVRNRRAPVGDATLLAKAGEADKIARQTVNAAHQTAKAKVAEKAIQEGLVHADDAAKFVNKSHKVQAITPYTPKAAASIAERILHDPIRVKTVFGDVKGDAKFFFDNTKFGKGANKPLLDYHVKALQGLGVLGTKEANGTYQILKGAKELTGKEGAVTRALIHDGESIGRVLTEPSNLAKSLEKGSAGVPHAYTEGAEATLKGLKNAELEAAGAAFALKTGAHQDLSERITNVLTTNAGKPTRKAAVTFRGEALVPLPGLAPVGRGIKKAVKATPGISKGADFFNETFRAKAGMDKAIDYVRRTTNAKYTNAIHANAFRLQKIWDNVSKEDRTGVLQSVRDGIKEGSVANGGRDIKFAVGDETDLVAHTIRDIKDLDNELMHLGASSYEVNKFLPNKYKIPKYRTVGGSAKYELSVPDRIMTQITKAEAIKDPAEALFYYDQAVRKLQAKRSIYDTVIQDLGVKKWSVFQDAKPGDLSHQAKELRRKGWRTPELKGNKDLFKNHLFDPQTAEGIEKLEKLLDNKESLEELGRAFDKITRLFKSAVTIYNPGFHVRTLMGEAMLNSFAGMPLREMPKYYALSTRVMRGRDRELFNKALEGGAEGLTRKEMRQSNLLGGFGPAENAKKIVNTPVGSLSADQIWHHYLSTGAKSGFVSADLVRSGADKAMLGANAAKISGKVHDVSELTEDYGRLAHFIWELQHTKAKTLDDAVKEAGEQVNKYHLDYTGTTKREERYLTKVIPFYKWMRLSAPMMLDVLLTNPGKALNIPKSLSAMSEFSGYDATGNGLFPGGSDAIVPAFLKDAYPMFKSGPNTMFFDPSNLFPLQGTAELGEQNIFTKMNPALAYPIELALNEAPYNRDPRSDPGKFLSAITPHTNLAYQMAKPSDPEISRLQRLLMYLGNPGLQENTSKKMSNEAFREEQASYKNRKVKQQELGLR